MRRKLAALGVAAVCLALAAPAQAVPCAGVQAALDAAPDNGTVVVDEGTCSGISLTLKPRPANALVTLEGAGDGARFDGGDPSSATKRILTGDDVGGIRLRNLAFESSSAPDGEGGGAVRIGGESAVTLDDVVITGSRAADGQDGGGALIESTSSRPTVVRNSLVGDPTYVVGNRARNGAGLAIENAAGAGEVQITGSAFDGNVASGSGGGLYVVQPGPGAITIVDSQANDNGALNGGGAALAGAGMTLQRSTFARNGAGGGGGGVHSGGGLYVTRTIAGGRIVQNDNRFEQNGVGSHGPGAFARGGGEWVQGADVTTTNDRFTRNYLTFAGAGSRGAGGALGVTSCGGTTVLRSANFMGAGNDAGEPGLGGAVYAGACAPGHVAATIQSSTIAGNHAAGAHAAAGLFGVAEDSLTLRNSIVAANRGAVDLRGFGSRSVRYSDACAPGVVPGQGNICADPVLVNPGGISATPDVRQTQASPTVDRGCSCYVGSNPPFARTQDFEGDRRDRGPAVDMGADEFAAPWPLRARVESVRRFGATLALVSPRNVCFANVRFQYGATRSYGRITGRVQHGIHCEPLPVRLTGLLPGRKYHFRIVASNASGTTVGLDQTFKTQKPRRAAAGAR